MTVWYHKKLLSACLYNSRTLLYHTREEWRLLYFTSATISRLWSVTIQAISIICSLSISKPDICNIAKIDSIWIKHVYMNTNHKNIYNSISICTVTFVAKKLNTCSLRVGNTCTNKIKTSDSQFYSIIVFYPILRALWKIDSFLMPISSFVTYSVSSKPN